MPTRTTKKKTSKSGAPRKSNAANKDDLAGLDELLNDPTLMAELEDGTIPPKKKNGLAPKGDDETQEEFVARTGAENARIGMAGFSQATKNPAMFAEAMGMLSDPNAVKEAEQMMNDPEFKVEIQRYMANLKSDPSFQQAMATAQAKFQELMQDPAKLEQLQSQYTQLSGGAEAPQVASSKDGETATNSESAAAAEGSSSGNTAETASEADAAAPAESTTAAESEGESAVADPGIDA